MENELVSGCMYTMRNSHRAGILSAHIQACSDR